MYKVNCSYPRNNKVQYKYKLQKIAKRMGSSIIQNETLQITLEQGFPAELQYETHLKKPFKAEDFHEKVFHFSDKDGIRNYQNPPVRNFLVQNIGGKWLYWGLVHVLSITHNYEKKSTSGTFKIIYIYTPEEMKYAHRLIDRNKTTDYLHAMQ